MPQSLAKILVHIVFSTKDRRPFLRDAGLRQETHRYLGGILQHYDSQPIIVGGVEDHVHLLATLSRSGTVADAIKEMKRSSTRWLKNKRMGLEDFSWQHGYGAFSVGFSQIEDVKNYIQRQETHHRKVPFCEEFVKLLKKYEITYDERFVWD